MQGPRLFRRKNGGTDIFLEEKNGRARTLCNNRILLCIKKNKEMPPIAPWNQEKDDFL